MEQTNSTMGKRIAALRKSCGLTQEQLAEKLGVSAQAVSKWENDVSCPDISLLPLLAATLGITVDELLGVKPIEPHVVIVEKDKSSSKDGDGKKGDRDWTKYVNLSGKSKRSAIFWGILWGIILIGIGAVILLGQLDVITIGTASFWGIMLALLIITAGAGWTINEPSPISVGVALYGIYLLFFNIGVISFELKWSMLWPVGLILIGLTCLQYILLYGRRRRIKLNGVSHGDKTPSSEFNMDEGSVRWEASFGSETRAFPANECFKGAKIEANFGDYGFDLRDCVSFENNAVLDLEVNFGNFTLYMPKNVKLVKSVDNSFAACVEDGSACDNPDYTLILKSDVNFGSMKIKY